MRPRARKVDDTRELLDNVQYAPTRSRYKIYLIDEVHMLSDAFVQRAAEDARGAAAARQVPARDHRSAEAAGDGAVALPAVQSEAPVGAADQLRGWRTSSMPRSSHTSRRRCSCWHRPPTAACAMRCRCSTSCWPSATARRVKREARAMLGTVARDHVERIATALAHGDCRPGLLAARRRSRSCRPIMRQLLDQLAALLERVALQQLVPGYAGDELYRAGTARRSRGADRRRGRAALLPDGDHRPARPGAGARSAHRLSHDADPHAGFPAGSAGDAGAGSNAHCSGRIGHADDVACDHCAAHRRAAARTPRNVQHRVGCDAGGHRTRRFDAHAGQQLHAARARARPAAPGARCAPEQRCAPGAARKSWRRH